MAARMTVVGDYKGGNLKQAGKDLNYIEAQAQGFSKSFMAGFAGIGASIGGMVALQSVVSMIKDTTQAAMDDQVAMASLGKTLENVGQGFKQTGVEDFISKMQLATGVADNDLRGAFQKLVTVTGDVEKSQTALKLAMDISAGTGKDLESVSAALAKGYGGQTTALQRLGVGIDAATLKSKNMGAITDVLSQKFGGQAAVAAQTYQGQMNRITQAVGEAQEAIGYSLLDAVDRLIGKMGGTGGLQSAILGAGNQIADFVDDVSLTIEQVDKLGRALVSLSTGGLVKVDAGFSIFWEVLKAVLGTILDIIGGPLVVLTRALEDLGLVSSDAGEGTEAYTSATVQAAIAAGQAAPAISGLGDDTEDAGLKAWESAKGYFAFYSALAAAAQVQRDIANTSGTVSSAIAEGFSGKYLKGAGEFAKLYGEAKKAVDDLGSSAGSAGAKAEELAIKWRQTAESITADVEGLKITMGGGGDVIAGNLVTAFQNRLGAFKQIVSEQVGIVQQARQALDSYAQSITDTIMGKINFSTVDPTTNQPLSPEQIVQMLLGDITNQQNAVTAIAGIAQQLPPALTQQIMALPPDAAIALANYLAANPALLEQLTLAYQALADFTKDKLGVPMAEKWAMVGSQSATSMIAEAKKTINDEAAAFQDFVTSKLSAKVKVKVVWESSPWDPEGLAVGGPVTGGTPYIVGERGPELFVPDASGSIIPNHDLPMAGSALGGGPTFVVNVTAGVGDPRAIGKSVVEAITLFERSSGPVFARA